MAFGFAAVTFTVKAFGLGAAIASAGPFSGAFSGTLPGALSDAFLGGPDSGAAIGAAYYAEATKRRPRSRGTMHLARPPRWSGGRGTRFRPRRHYA